MKITNTTITGDSLKILRKLESKSVQLIFTDPPYNIGYAYDEYQDRRDPNEYLWWCEGWLRECVRLLSQNGSLWVVICDEYVSEIDLICKKLGLTRRSWIVWYYTFGVNCKKNFSRSHTHLLYFVKHPKKFIFNPQDIGVPSARQTVYKDKRAAGLRLPDNTWILRPQEIDAFFSHENTWHIPRVCGTYSERVAGATNQLPELLCERVIKACSNPDDLVLDPFGGTGTIAYTAKKLGRDYITIELSHKWAENIRKRLAS